MNAFDSTETILKEIHENGGYTWGTKTCNAKNHTIGFSLRSLVSDGYLYERKISGWFISKYEYTLTDKGLEELQKYN